MKKIKEILKHCREKLGILFIIKRLLLISLGSILAAFSFSLFQVPFNLAAGGLSGVGIIVNDYTNLPIGVIILILNIPILVLGYYKLGMLYFVFSTVISVIIFSSSIDIFH